MLGPARSSTRTNSLANSHIAKNLLAVLSIDLREGKAAREAEVEGRGWDWRSFTTSSCGGRGQVVKLTSFSCACLAGIREKTFSLSGDE